jgi:hypothetical protein
MEVGVLDTPASIRIFVLEARLAHYFVLKLLFALIKTTLLLH